MKSTVMGRWIARARSAITMTAPLRTPTSSSCFPDVVGVDRGREFGDLGLNFLLAQQNPGEVVADVELVHPVRPSTSSLVRCSVSVPR